MNTCFFEDLGLMVSGITPPGYVGVYKQTADIMIPNSLCTHGIGVPHQAGPIALA